MIYFIGNKSQLINSMGAETSCEVESFIASNAAASIAEYNKQQNSKINTSLTIEQAKTELDNASAALNTAKANVESRRKIYIAATNFMAKKGALYYLQRDQSTEKTAQTKYDNALKNYNAAKERAQKAVAAVKAAADARLEADKNAAINGYNAYSSFMEKANLFENALQDKTLLTKMKSAWTAYTTGRTNYQNGDKTIDIIKLFYTDFIGAKNAYANAVVTILRETNEDRNYVTNNKADATTYKLTKEYDAMSKAWNTVDTAAKINVDPVDIATIVLRYSDYIIAKNEFIKVLAVAKAKEAWDAAVVVATTARATWSEQQQKYTYAKSAEVSAKLVYTNAQKAYDNTKTKKDNYDEALKQQTEANKLLESTSGLLKGVDAGLRTTINNKYQENATFMQNAAAFFNTAFGIKTQYDTMSGAWNAYNAAKKVLDGLPVSSKITAFTAATEKLVETYNTFSTSKTTYANAVINAMNLNTADRDYIETNKKSMETYRITYDISNEFNAMKDTWDKVLTATNTSNASDIIILYNAFVPKKEAFKNALLLAQDKKAEADFQSNLAAGKMTTGKWLQSGTNGCRNMQTAASTNADMLDQDIACNENEFISGYTNVSGFEAAPVGPSITRDNIAQYLAVKYSCCIAPTGEKGAKGKKGLPGLDGVSGKIGPIGPVGIEGPPGIRGPPGEIGEEGTKGPRGDQGDHGINGEMGPAGEPGRTIVAPFIKQLEGPQGKPGIQGPRGKQGPKGPDGKVIPVPSQPAPELDGTLALLNLQKKINPFSRS